MSHSSSVGEVRTIALAAAHSELHEERYFGLDWLRAIATILVVMLHGGLAYTLVPWPGIAWPTHDRFPSSSVDAASWWINGFMMPLFFVLGGFVAAHLLLKRGPRGFLEHRVRRILLPFLFGCLIVLPASLYVWLLGWVVDGRISLRKLRSLKLGEVGENLWGVGHLWFLQYLFLFCAVMWAVQLVWDMWHAVRAARGRRTSVRHGLDSLLDSPPAALLKPLVLALPCALALWWEPRIVIGFRNSWHPLAANLLYYAPCFCFGWWMLHRRRSGHHVCRYAWLHAAASLVVFAFLLPMVREHVAEESTGPRRIVLCLLFASFAWLSTVGWFGLFLNHFGRPPRWVAYLAESSFWMYLFHHPIVGLAQVSLAGSHLPAWSKFLIASGTAVCLSLLTYEVGVRRTWIGVLLNGRRAPARTDASRGTVPFSERSDKPVESPERRAA